MARARRTRSFGPLAPLGVLRMTAALLSEPAVTGSDSELERLKRYVPGYFDLMTAWLLARINVDK